MGRLRRWKGKWALGVIYPLLEFSHIVFSPFFSHLACRKKMEKDKMTLQYWAKIESEKRDQNNGAWLMSLTFPPFNLRNEFQIKIYPTFLLFSTFFCCLVLLEYLEYVLLQKNRKKWSRHQVCPNSQLYFRQLPRMKRRS